MSTKIFYSLLFFMFSSCGHKKNSTEAKPPPINSPSQCIISESASESLSASITRQPKNPPFFSTYNKANRPLPRHYPMNIVGGDNTDSSLSCQTNSPDAKTISDKNTVAILLKKKGEKDYSILCTGTVVSSDLILTAAHCFDEVDLSSSSPGSVVFSNDVRDKENRADIACWQRSEQYISCQSNNSYSCILNDIAWIRIHGDVANYNYTPVTLLSDPYSITPTEEKMLSGFGYLNENVPSDGKKHCVSTKASDKYIGDILPAESVNQFNALTFKNAYQDYLTVIGPIPGNNPNPDETSTSSMSAKGSCNGDSGGPVYINREGKWILAALVQGSNKILTPIPLETAPPYSHFDKTSYAGCQYGYGVYTTVGHYLSWLEKSSGEFLSRY